MATRITTVHRIMSEVNVHNDGQAFVVDATSASASASHRDYYAGALMVLLGGYAVSQGLRYGVGSLTSMGPGFFPLSIGVILAGVGLVIGIGPYVRRSRQRGAPSHAHQPSSAVAASSLTAPSFSSQSSSIIETAVETEATAEAMMATPPGKHRRVTPLDVRAWSCMISSIVAFIVVGRHGGLLPASFAVVFIAAMGDPKNGWRQSLALALCICLICVLVFWWALKVEMPLFTWGG